MSAVSRTKKAATTLDISAFTGNLITSRAFALIGQSASGLALLSLVFRANGIAITQMFLGNIRPITHAN